MKKKMKNKRKKQLITKYKFRWFAAFGPIPKDFFRSIHDQPKVMNIKPHKYNNQIAP